MWPQLRSAPARSGLDVNACYSDMTPLFEAVVTRCPAASPDPAALWDDDSRE